MTRASDLPLGCRRSRDGQGTRLHQGRFGGSIRCAARAGDREGGSSCMNSGVQVIGVYRWPFTADDVARLSAGLCSIAGDDDDAARDQLANLVVVELRTSATNAVDLDGISQTPPAERTRNEQVPYDEQWWSDDGTRCFKDKPPDESPCRVVFFPALLQCRSTTLLPRWNSNGNSEPHRPPRPAHGNSDVRSALNCDTRTLARRWE